MQPALSYNAANITDANGSGYGGVPGIFKHLATTAGCNYYVTIEAVSSQTLAYHAANRTSIIGRAGWDVVVLQEQSSLPIPVARGGHQENASRRIAPRHRASHLHHGSNHRFKPIHVCLH